MNATSNEIKLRTVYKLVRTDKPEDGTDVYVGSTSLTLKKRLRIHRYDAKRKCSKLYTKMNDVGIYSWKIIPLLTFSCNQKTIREFERRWCETIGADLNMISAIITKEEKRENNLRNYAKYYKSNKDTILRKKTEYRKLNKETIKQKQTKYFESNKDTIKQKRAKYYESNKDTINQKHVKYRKSTIQNRVHHCNICARSFESKRDLQRHFDSLKHQYTYLNSLD